MDRTIKTFKVDFDYDDIQLSGICRWVGEQMQVEMTAPMNGIVSFVCRWPFRPRMIENTVEDEAIEELQRILLDLFVIDRNMEKYRKIGKAYQAYKHKVTRRNAELKKTLAELETQYADHTIDRKEYRFQKKLIEDSLRFTNVKLYEFERVIYYQYKKLPHISPYYVCQILRWIDRHPTEARKLIDICRERNEYNLRMVEKEEEERKGV